MKVRLTMVATTEYNINKKDLKDMYNDKASTIEEAMKIDIASYVDDPDIFLYSATNIKITGEVIK